MNTLVLISAGILLIVAVHIQAMPTAEEAVAAVKDENVHQISKRSGSFSDSSGGRGFRRSRGFRRQRQFIPRRRQIIGRRQGGRRFRKNFGGRQRSFRQNKFFSGRNNFFGGDYIYGDDFYNNY